MRSDYYYWRELEKLRNERRGAQPIALELPAPSMPYWQERETEESEEEESHRGVVIIDMNDYDDVEV
jgi:hypothetical protein